jgi:putative isomerase
MLACPTYHSNFAMTVLRTPNVSLARAWNTWEAGYPAEMRFLPLGIRLTPLAYAASVNRTTLFPPGPDVVLGRHALDGRAVELELNHAGTSLHLAYAKASDYDLTCKWSTGTAGEWGLR